MVYVIDDDPMVLQSLAELLQASGLRVTACAGPNDLMPILNPGDRGCIIIDYLMPEMNGLKLLHRLKEKQILLPVIMISGQSDPGEVDNARAAGAFEFLYKPFDAANLLEIICRAIQTMPPPRPLIH